MRSQIQIILITILGVIMSSGLASGQKYVTIKASSSIDKMMDKFIENGKANEKIKAWRIQIITTDNRREMEQTLALFEAMYPGVSRDWKHVSPYYQVRVGYYENKNKLMPFLLELKKKFPTATPVYDDINKKTLVSR